MASTDDEIRKKIDSLTKDRLELSPYEYSNILNEIMDQPSWRSLADKCHEYYDGNQTDAATLQALADIGMEPQIENLMAPTIDAITGLEAKTRRDWKVIAQNEGDYDPVAEALGQRLYDAEQQTFADRANTEAFRHAVIGGIGWIHVSRNNDPFKFPYKYQFVHRDEIYWDMKWTEADFGDMRWLLRSKWYDLDMVKAKFKGHRELLELAVNNWNDLSMYLDNDKLQQPLQYSHEVQRAYPLEGYDWINSGRRRIRLNELWYRRWVEGNVIYLPNGAVAEFDEENEMHLQAAYAGFRVVKANFSKVRVSIWAGMHKLIDMPNPYKHGEIPYTPVFGNLEDKTRTPYGEGKAMIPMQDEINTRNTKMIWLLAAKRITMTDGVAVDDIEVVRQEAGRPDALHVLDPRKLKEGGMFKVETDFQLNDQQYKSLVDKRQQLKMVAGVFAAFEGSSNNQSGIALQQATEQSSQTLANLYDTHQFARTRAGNQLLSLIIEDIGEQETPVTVTSDIQDSKVIVLNKRNPDGTMTNAIQMARSKVQLSEVPSTSSYKQQTLQHISQITSGLPPQYQAVMVKLLIKLTDIPAADKQEIIESIAKVNGEQINKTPKTPEEAEQMKAAQQAAAKQQEMGMRDAEAELQLKEAKAMEARAKAEKLAKEAGNDGQAQMDAIKQEYENMLIQAKEEFDTKKLEIKTKYDTAILVAKIEAQSRERIAAQTSKDKEQLSILQQELDEIYRLLGIDTQSSDTDNQQVAA